MLDNKINEVIDRVLPFTTDAIWLGKANFLLRRLKMNGYSDKKSLKKANELIQWQSDDNMIELYNKYKNNSKIKWKESIKKVVGLDLPTEKGLDI
ncbi:MAG: hypothetical protein HOK80_06965, partial [Candidatus Cloacimonetes bacterium]|nr:hypothetical protein [Candidatus Cloacimonadota bacterium]